MAENGRVLVLEAVRPLESPPGEDDEGMALVAADAFHPGDEPAGVIGMDAVYLETDAQGSHLLTRPLMSAYQSTELTSLG